MRGWAFRRYSTSYQTKLAPGFYEGANSYPYIKKTTLSLDFQSPTIYALAPVDNIRFHTAPATASTSYRWQFDAASGNLVDSLSGTSAELEESGTPKRSAFSGLAARDGMLGYKCVSFAPATNDLFKCTSAAIMNPGTSDFSVNIVAYLSSAFLEKGTLIWKNPGGGDAGYRIWIDSSGILNAEITNGTDTGGGALDAAALTGGWHVITVNFDRSGNISARVNGVNMDAPKAITVADTDDITNTSKFVVGGAGESTGSFLGKIAEVMYSDGLTTDAEHDSYHYYLLRYGQDKLTHTRTLDLISPVYDAGTSENIYLNEYAANQVSLFTIYSANKGYSTRTAENPDGLGALFSRPSTNLCLQARRLNTSPWASSNATVEELYDYGPDDTKQATKITATSAGGLVKQAFASITAVNHVVYLYAKSATGSDVAITLRVVRNSNNSVIGTANHTCTTVWKRLGVSGVAVLNDTRIEIIVTNNGDSILCDSVVFRSETEGVGYLNHGVCTRDASRLSYQPVCTVTDYQNIIEPKYGYVKMRLMNLRENSVHVPFCYEETTVNRLIPVYIHQHKVKVYHVKASGTAADFTGTSMVTNYKVLFDLFGEWALYYPMLTRRMPSIAKIAKFDNSFSETIVGDTARGFFTWTTPFSNGKIILGAALISNGWGGDGSNVLLKLTAGKVI